MYFLERKFGIFKFQVGYSFVVITSKGKQLLMFFYCSSTYNYSFSIKDYDAKTKATIAQIEPRIKNFHDELVTCCEKLKQQLLNLDRQYKIDFENERCNKLATNKFETSG